MPTYLSFVQSSWTLPLRYLVNGGGAPPRLSAVAGGMVKLGFSVAAYQYEYFWSLLLYIRVLSPS